MRNYKEHLISVNVTIKEALIRLNELAKDAILFVVDTNNTLLGSLTDGDVRRGLIRGCRLEDTVVDIIQPHPRFLRKGETPIEKIVEYREKDLRIIPVLDENNTIINVVNFGYLRSYLPLDVVIMAGGRGERLKPLTDNIPKPLLKVGDKSIIEHNIDRLRYYGITNFLISVHYLGEQITAYLGNGSERNIKIDYIWEDKPLGTIGAASKIENVQHQYILLTNSDILTNLDYEHFFLDFINRKADMSILTIPYKVSVPYAVVQTDRHHILSFEEKPTYTYYANGGVYLMKKQLLEYIPKNTLYNATDLLDLLIKKEKKVISYPLIGYWLDIGKKADYEKAQTDIHQIKF